MTIHRPPRPTTLPEAPPEDAPEGLRAAWWREHLMKLSRPALADMLGIEKQRIIRYENMDVVPSLYRMACAALASQVDGGFNWSTDNAS